MSEDLENESEQTSASSWREKLSRVFLHEPKNESQLRAILQDCQERGLIDADSLAMFEGVLEVAKLQVRDIMIPRSQMVLLEKDATLKEILPEVSSSGHSRFPVIGENRDDVVGILLAKDLLRFHFQADEQPFIKEKLLRDPVFVPESKRVDVLLREFRLNHNHMAIVVDEYGGIAGLVTIEDILEQIVGDIEDEYDTEEEPNIKAQSDNRYIIKALTPIEEFNEFFDESLSDEECDTIGGYLTQHVGYVPKKSEVVHLGKYRFKILSADDRRIRTMLMRVA